MQRISATLAAMVLVSSLVGSAYAADGGLAKDDAAENYCHLRFPAIRQRTLDTANPQLKRASTGDTIDYYGACDETPTSQSQILEQKHDEGFRFGREYEDGD